MKKVIHQGSEGLIMAYGFRLFGKAWYFAISETKWHAGEKYKRMPIWTAYKNGIPSLYIWNLAIGFDNRKKN